MLKERERGGGQGGLYDTDVIRLTIINQEGPFAHMAELQKESVEKYFFSLASFF